MVRCLGRILLLPMTIFLTVFLVACGQTGIESNNTKQPEEVKPVELTISAAASLKGAMEEIKRAYLNEKPGVTITYNFGSSGSLQRQIELGGEVDVFVSAATKQMDALENKSLIIEDTRKDFLENKIVLVVPENSMEVIDFKDLLTDKVKKVGLGEPRSVPVGQYAEEVLTKLDILDSIKPKAVYGKDVKEVLTWVETGNADAAMVYETDAKVSDKVKLVARAPEGSHKSIFYPAAVIKSSKNIDAAKDYIDFLYSSKAKPIFEKHGFVFLIK